MKVLFVVRQKKNVDTFLGTIRSLLDRGHAVTLAVQERPDARLEELVAELGSARFSLVPCPPLRTDGWTDAAPLLRSLRDCVHYQRPALRGAAKLQARTIEKLREDLRVVAGDDEAAAMLRGLPEQQVRHLEALLALAEERLPADPLYDEFLRAEAPDVVLVSPLVHFGSAQADIVASARVLGLPVGMLLFSWDNLSTKGFLHRQPDWMFVWNEEQRREARRLHGFPENRVVVVGAPRFDGFFALGPQMTREAFLGPLGLDPAKPTLLYVCSSAFVSAGELGFVRKWIETLRASSSLELSDCNVLVRPHPDIPLLGADEAVEELRWPALPGKKAFVSRPFGDRRAVVLRTSDRAQQGFFECIWHSAAVIGLNTSAELESAIVGRPVYTVLADEADADGQRSTLHFHYLLEGHGGCVRAARGLEEHAGQLAAELRAPSDGESFRRFAATFLRPLGIDRPVAPLLAEAIERTFGPGGTQAAASVTGVPPTTAASTAIETNTGDGAAVAERVVVSLGVGRGGEAIELHVDGGEDARRPRLDRTTIQWIQEHVRVGDVFCDAEAGIGLYSLAVARHRGALVIAFEPGYAAFKELCDNLLLNGCDGSVMAVPLALSDFEGVGDLKFPSERVGGPRHAVRRAPFRQRRGARDGHAVVQSACVTSLDAAFSRYAWPPPNHLRLADAASVAPILDGARSFLAFETLRTIFLTSQAEDVPALEARLEPTGWRVVARTPISREREHVLLTRERTAGR